MRNVLFVVFFCASATPTYAHGPLLPPGHGLHGPLPSPHGPLLPRKVAGDPSFVTDCTVLDGGIHRLGATHVGADRLVRLRIALLALEPAAHLGESVSPSRCRS